MYLLTKKIKELTENDLVFVTNGSITESSTQGSPTQAAPKTSELGGSWKLWQNLAKQSEEFGHPDVFFVRTFQKKLGLYQQLSLGKI